MLTASALKVLFIIHLGLAAQVPPELGADVWAAAEAHSVDPYDLAALLISEESGKHWNFSLTKAAARRDRGTRFVYKSTAEGQAGEQGYFQISESWRRKYARQVLGDPKAEVDLTDPTVNVYVGAFVMAKALESHADHSDKKHHWTAHWKCGRGARNDSCGGCKQAQVKWKGIRSSLMRLTTTKEQRKTRRREWNAAVCTTS